MTLISPGRVLGVLLFTAGDEDFKVPFAKDGWNTIVSQRPSEATWVTMTQQHINMRISDG